MGQYLLNRRFILLVCSMMSACHEVAMGNTCGDDGSSFAVDTPIDGEVSVAEIVRLERDTRCESLQCLTQKGLPPFCTRECSVKSAKGNASRCNNDVDCQDGLQCQNNRCVDDTCPAGYSCKAVQEAGSLADRLFCTRRENCSNNVDCEDLSRLSCQQRVCFDTCLLEPECDAHVLTCRLSADLTCSCPPNETCTDDNLQCQGPNQTMPWPAGAVRSLSVCMEVAP